MDGATAICNETEGWLIKGLMLQRASLATALSNANQARAPRQVSLDAQLDFLNAALRSDMAVARAQIEDLRTPVARRALLLRSVETLQVSLQTRRHSPGEVAQAFGLLRRLSATLDGSASGRTRRCGNFVLFVPAEEDHLLGPQMLADRLTAEGWDVTMITGQDPRDVLQEVSTAATCALGISVGYDRNLLGMADFILDARMESVNSKLEVLLGGGAFTAPLEQYAFLGADRIFLDAGAASRHLRQRQDPLPAEKRL